MNGEEGNVFGAGNKMQWLIWHEEAMVLCETRGKGERGQCKSVWGGTPLKSTMSVAHTTRWMENFLCSCVCGCVYVSVCVSFRDIWRALSAFEWNKITSNPKLSMALQYLTCHTVFWWMYPTFTNCCSLILFIVCAKPNHFHRIIFDRLK